MSQTYEEIMATPESLGKTAAFLESKAEFLGKIFADNHKRIVFIGCGSSYCIAKSAARTAMTRLNREAVALAGGDVLLHAESYGALFQNAVVVTISRSGSTSEVIYAVREMKKIAEFELLSISCVKDSPMSGMADFSLEMPWAFDASVCQTRNVTCLFYACVLLIALVAGDDTLRKSLVAASGILPGFIDANAAQFEKIADMPWKNAVTLGDAEISGLCEEAALAYNEICQLPGVFYNLLDSRHGPMVMFRKDTLVVAALSNCGAFEVELVKDAVAKGSVVVTLSDTPCAVAGSVNIATGVAGSHVARGIPFLVANQFISLNKSATTGANPDQPDGLTPWIKI